MNWVLKDVVDSLFVPGVNAGVIVVIHGVCISCIIFLASLAYFVGNGHIYVLLGLSTVFYALIAWFLIECRGFALKEQLRAAENYKENNEIYERLGNTVDPDLKERMSTFFPLHPHEKEE